MFSPALSGVATERSGRMYGKRSRMNHKATITFLFLTMYGVIGSSDYFWHYTDVHVDPTYETTQESCNVNVTDSPFGSYDCDAPWRLVVSSVNAMKRIGPKPAFIVWSGDTGHHPKNPNDLSREKIIEVIKNLTGLLRTTFPGVAVFPCLGNHDYFPHNQLPARDKAYYGGLTELWRPWLRERDAEVTFMQGGYYTLMLRPQDKVRVVVLNTNFYYTHNDVTGLGKDPAGQFAWLDSVLSNATTNGEKIHLIFHIHPGYLGSNRVYWFRPTYNAVFNELCRRYASIIVGMYTGHSHTDTFRLIYENGKPVASMLLAPSVTPWRARIPGNRLTPARNPGIRRVMMTSDYTHLLDVEQYYLPLAEANERGVDEWKLEYSFTKDYGLKDATTASLQTLLEDFKGNSSKNFDQYYIFNSVNAQTKSNEPCSCECRKLQLCAIEYIEYDDCEYDDERTAECSAASDVVGRSATLCVIVCYAFYIALFFSV